MQFTVGSEEFDRKILYFAIFIMYCGEVNYLNYLVNLFRIIFSCFIVERLVSLFVKNKLKNMKIYIFICFLILVIMYFIFNEVVVFKLLFTSYLCSLIISLIIKFYMIDKNKLLSSPLFTKLLKIKAVCNDNVISTTTRLGDYIKVSVDRDSCIMTKYNTSIPMHKATAFKGEEQINITSFYHGSYQFKPSDIGCSKIVVEVNDHLKTYGMDDILTINDIISLSLDN